MPPSPPAIYLHIGPPKTGTTYLQEVLWANRRRLEQLDVEFPGSSTVEHFHAALDLRGIAFGGHDNPAVTGAWSRLADKAFSSDAAKVVISHEMFAGATESQIQTVAESLAPAEVHVIYGARDLARQLPAVWQESLKNRRSRTYQRFLRATLASTDDDDPRGFWRAQDIGATLGRWEAAAPPDRVHVLTLPQAGGSPTTLWERLCSILRIEHAGFDLEAARPNPSLSPDDAEVLRLLNRALPDALPWPSYERIVKRRFNRHAESSPGAARLTVPEEYHEQVLARSRDICASLGTSGYDIVGDLDDLLPVDTAFGTSAEVSADRVADAAVSILADVLTDQAISKERHPRERARQMLDHLRRGRGKRDG